MTTTKTIRQGAHLRDLLCCIKAWRNCFQKVLFPPCCSRKTHHDGKQSFCKAPNLSKLTLVCNWCNLVSLLSNSETAQLHFTQRIGAWSFWSLVWGILKRAVWPDAMLPSWLRPWLLRLAWELLPGKLGLLVASSGSLRSFGFPTAPVS